MQWPAVIGRPFADVPMSLWDQIVGPSLFELSRANQVYDDAGHRQTLRRAMPWVENEGLLGLPFGGIPWRTRLGIGPRDIRQIVEPWNAPQPAPSPSSEPLPASPPQDSQSHGGPTTPSSFVKEYLGLDPHEFKGDVDLGDREIYIDGRIIKDGRDIGSVERKINLASGTAHHEYTSLKSNRQASGIGKALLKANINYYRRNGIKRVTNDANIDVGSYAWARYGFKPKSALAWIEMIPSIRARAQEMNLPPQIMHAVRAATRSPNPENIWKIADMRYRLPPTKDYPHGRTLGAALLMNRDWMGVLDLTNPRVNERFDAYVGK